MARTTSAPPPPHRLDPRCDYVVFETALGRTGTSPWAAVRQALAGYREGILEEVVRESAVRTRLIIKLAPATADAIKAHVLAMELPETILAYVYHRFDKPAAARPADATRQRRPRRRPSGSSRLHPNPQRRRQ